MNGLWTVDMDMGVKMLPTVKMKMKKDINTAQ